MTLPVILTACLGVVLCLCPLTIYLIWVSVLNRRDHPTPVDGTWDFAGLLLGLSGFLLFGGATVVSLFQSNVRYWQRGNGEAARAAWEHEKRAWAVYAGAYVLGVGGAAALGFRGRRRTLVVYNIDPDDLDESLTGAVRAAGREPQRRGHQWFADRLLCEAEPFEAGRAVTVRWLSDDRGLCQEVERHLRRAVPSVPSPGPTPVAAVLSSVIGVSTALILICFFLLVYAAVAAR